jgi:hypothetical protein
VDIISAYVVATPVAGGGGDHTPPTVSITSPANGDSVSGNVTISADASDIGGSGVAKVDFRLDDPSSGPLLGTATNSYSINWDSGTTAPGLHKLYAIATDNANNIGTTFISITVNAPTPPAAKITNPVNGGTVPKKSAFTIVASVTPKTYPVISRIDFLVGSAVVCTGTATSCKWQVPAAPGKTYQLRVNAYDTKGNVGFDAVTVKSK